MVTNLINTLQETVIIFWKGSDIYSLHDVCLFFLLTFATWHIRLRLCSVTGNCGILFRCLFCKMPI